MTDEELAKVYALGCGVSTANGLRAVFDAGVSEGKKQYSTIPPVEPVVAKLKKYISKPLAKVGRNLKVSGKKKK